MNAWLLASGGVFLRCLSITLSTAILVSNVLLAMLRFLIVAIELIRIILGATLAIAEVLRLGLTKRQDSDATKRTPVRGESGQKHSYNLRSSSQKKI